MGPATSSNTFFLFFFEVLRVLQEGRKNPHCQVLPTGTSLDPAEFPYESNNIVSYQGQVPEIGAVPCI